MNLNLGIRLIAPPAIRPTGAASRRNWRFIAARESAEPCQPSPPDCDRPLLSVAAGPDEAGTQCSRCSFVSVMPTFGVTNSVSAT
jgi:hypothetical protein